MQSSYRANRAGHGSPTWSLATWVFEMAVALPKEPPEERVESLAEEVAAGEEIGEIGENEMKSTPSDPATRVPGYPPCTAMPSINRR